MGVTKSAIRVAASLAGVGALTLGAYRLIPVNATTAGFAYLLLILVIASEWGFVEAAAASVAATLAFNFFFLPPVGTLTIADPQNWVALFSLLITSLIASRLSAKAERRAQEAIARRGDLERLYTFSRAILLIDEGEPFARQLAQKLAAVFEVEAAVLYDGRTGQIYRGGPTEFEGMEEQLQDAARHGASYSDAEKTRLITAIRLGAEPIGALALQGREMPDAVLQGIANLVAIGLERARAQDLTHQVEAARRSGQIRTTLLDAIAHEFKTPLTSIRAATTTLLANPDLPGAARSELLAAADEEAEQLNLLINDALEMARLDAEQIDLKREATPLATVVREALAALRPRLEGREVVMEGGGEPDAVVPLDRRLVALALRQILNNALKYSPAGTAVTIALGREDGAAVIAISNEGEGIPPQEAERIFERFYRGAGVKRQIPGSGLGLSIAHTIVQAHGGTLRVVSGSAPGKTTLRLTLPGGAE